MFHVVTRHKVCFTPKTFQCHMFTVILVKEHYAVLQIPRSWLIYCECNKVAFNLICGLLYKYDNVPIMIVVQEKDSFRTAKSFNFDLLRKTKN